MMKNYICFVLVGCLVLLFTGCTAANNQSSDLADPRDISSDWSFINQGNNGGLETVGLYIWDPNPAQYDFFKASGYNLLQFCDRSWFWNEGTTAYTNYLTGMQNGIKQAKESGFTVEMTFFSNILQYYGPAATEPTGLGIKFHPDDEAKLQQRLDELRHSLSFMEAVDVFSIFAGDPGGISNDMGNGDVYDFVKVAHAMVKVIKEVYPNAHVNINTWAVTYYQTPNISAHTAEFWLNENELNRIMFDMPDLFGEKVGIELACHDYYRPLALQSYFDAWKIPEERYPTVSDIATLLNRGTQRVWAWPYFLLDEADDGHSGVERTTLPQLESRYICDYLDRIRESGFNGAIGNWSYAGYKTKMFNLYAFGRACNDMSVTSEQLLHEFASAIATPETRHALVEVFKYIENDSNFSKKTPVVFRQKDYDVSLLSDQEALDLLKTVQPNLNNRFPLPYSPEEYLTDLRARLEWSMQQ